MKQLLSLIAAVALGVISLAAADTDLAGTWKGRLEVMPGRSLALVFHIKADPQSVTMDSPDQGAYGIPAELAYLSADSVSIKLPSLQIGYNAHIEGGALVGTFTQGPAKFPLKLTSTDALAAQVEQLDEVVIEAPRLIRKSDMDVYLPSASAVEYSRNGMQLLQNLMIPSLSVNDALGSITASGESVQVRINGRVSSIEDVRAIDPSTIKRVEWLDNPGLRYGNANYVLNFIVRNPAVGGSLMAGVNQGLTGAWGNYYAVAKFNSGPSQWNIGATFKLTENLKTSRDYTERFTYPDGTSVTRTETPLDGSSIDNSFGNLYGSYSYIKPDTTTFYAAIGANRNFNNHIKYNGLLSLSDESDDILLHQSSGDRGTTPGLSLYLEQSLGRRQTLVVDFSAICYFGHTFSDYTEMLSGQPTPLSDIHTYISDRNQAYGLEANYIKNWDKGKFTAGGSYTANRNRSEYRNLAGAIFHQRQDKAYFFGEYFRKLGKFTATAGVGAQYTDFNFTETNQGRSSWNVRPKANITYNINQAHRLRLDFTSWQTAPSLAETNIAPQQVDGFQWTVGNPNLKTSTSYQLTARYNFSAKCVDGTLGLRGFLSPDAITPYLYWDNDRLITTYENSRGLRQLTAWLSPKIDVVPGWLTVSGTLNYRLERMRGTGYTHNYHSWYGDVTAQAMHWGFTLVVQYNRAARSLWGDRISWGEDISIVALQYNWRDWGFLAGMIMPFGKYDQGSISLNKWNSNEQHMRPDLRLPIVKVTYNVQWGRQKADAQRKVQSDAEVTTSKASGR